ncbi:unnamed protein product [Phytophthora fragariaefolia]|uniref:Unnamed protein product n=1 Tax=Phytophthora fragariaefolia TaxID=1490495 RepID=A0A9W6TLK5_9STRA|nr:unnamed protein product [Phytophthora fragariaefolia]
MTVLIDSGASFNFATKASVARDSVMCASALEASHAVPGRPAAPDKSLVRAGRLSTRRLSRSHSAQQSAPGTQGVGRPRLPQGESSKRYVTDVSVRLATGSIASIRKVVSPLKVTFDDFDSVELFIVLDMDDRYDLILGMTWLAKNEPWIDWRSQTIGASHKSLAGRALVGHVTAGYGYIRR